MSHQAKKSMGQNFLKSQEALRAMCSAGEVCEKDTILEIGPGKGALTEKLLEMARCVIAVEKDRDLIEILKEKFASEIKNNKLILVEDDILNFSPKDFKLSGGGYKVIANIPYNITGAIFKKFLSNDTQPERMVLLVQKEVAERIVARDRKESILSLSVKVYSTPKYIMKVHKRFFSPEPKVDSAIVAITNISKNSFKTTEEENKFFYIVKNGFAHKRKVLRKNLENIEENKGDIDLFFKKLNIDTKTRAEDIKIEKWLEILNNFSIKI